MGDLKKYGLTEEDKKKMEEIQKKQRSSLGQMTPEQIARQSALRKREYSGPSASRDEER